MAFEFVSTKTNCFLNTNSQRWKAPNIFVQSCVVFDMTGYVGGSANLTKKRQISTLNLKFK